MPNYRIICRKKEDNSGALVRWKETLPNVKSLAKYLNGLVKRKKYLHVIACYVEDKDEKFISNVKFLQSEYASQRWLTGYSERLLANAIEIYGMDLKWSSGLKPSSLVLVRAEVENEQ